VDVAEVGAAPALWFARHCARNCGQVQPPVVPADWASFHSLAQIFMTLWAFAVVGPARASPNAIVAAVSQEMNEWRMPFRPNRATQPARR